MDNRTPTWLKVPYGKGQIRVRHYPGKGRPLVLLHGFLDSSLGWETYAKSSHRPCYAIDLPGFGDSALPPEPTLKAYAHSVIQVVDNLDLQEACLVGHSLGGAVATLAAEELEDRILSLILLAPAGFGRIPMAEIADLPLVREALNSGLPLALMNPLLMSVIYAYQVSGGQPAPLDLSLRLMTQGLKLRKGASMGLKTLARMSQDLKKGIIPPPAYRGPVAALWGSKDRLIPLAHAKNLKKLLPQAHVEIWPRMAHHPQVERPQELGRFIEKYATRARHEKKRRKRKIK